MSFVSCLRADLMVLKFISDPPLALNPGASRMSSEKVTAEARRPLLFLELQIFLSPAVESIKFNAQAGVPKTLICHGL